MSSPAEWADRLRSLRVDRASGDPAPHKPLLLLVVLDLAELSELPPRMLALTPELAFRFIAYWAIVAHRRRQPPDVRLPFHHLKSDGCWSPLDGDGKPSTDPRCTRYAKLADDFAAFVSDPAARAEARRILIARYFEPGERLALYEAAGIPIPTDEQVKVDAAARAPDAIAVGREARFRVRVVSAYEYTCALTGYRCTTITAGSIVDAAHIRAFADSRNNSVDNGFALSKNAHWLFDQGLWSATDDFKIVIATGCFAESGPCGLLADLGGSTLRLPRDRSCWPNPIHLAWHRKHRFVAGAP
jgi:putative restriction endonuclease